MSEQAGLTRLFDAEWEAFISQAQSILILTRLDCEGCETLLKSPVLQQSGFPVGYLVLDEPGVKQFKQANQWINREVDLLPFSIRYEAGLRVATTRGSDAEKVLESLNVHRT
jgi:hypothetical protein